MSEPLEASTAWVPRRATRDTSDRYLGGVASGVARHLGVGVLWVRVAFVVGAILGGVGIALYAGLWLVLPSDDRFAADPPGFEAASRAGKRPAARRSLSDVGPLIALAAIGLGAVLVIELTFGRGALFWPLALGLGGAALIWRQADEAQRERWLNATGQVNVARAFIGGGGAASWVRLGVGALLMLSGLALFAFRSGQLEMATEVVLAALLGIIGLAITLGPWVFRLASDLGKERAERIRSQERADVAAHLHDSVLQTLALIQKSAGDASTVARLARAQERDLRDWLFSGEQREESLVGALRTLVTEVEAVHPIVVEVVTVGDTPLTGYGFGPGGRH